jgi:hypothetical protein
MSFNIYFSAPGGIVTVKIPTEQLDGKTSVDQEPFRLQIQSNGGNRFDSIMSPMWSSSPDGVLTTYTRRDPLESGETVELMPLSGLAMGDNFYFPATGFIAAGGTMTVSVIEPDNIAPTLAADGIKEVQVNANGSPLSIDGKESAYTVSFSERVSIPTMQAQSSFGGMPTGSTFLLTQMAPTSTSTTVAAGFSDVWHVKVTTLNATDTVNLTLTPKLQVITYDTANASPPAGTTVVGSNTATHWAKVTLDGDLYEGRVFDSGQLTVNFMGQDNTPGGFAQTVAVATSTSAKDVLYLGFSSQPPQPTAGDVIQLNTTSAISNYASPLGGMITDLSGNQMEYASFENPANPMEPLVSVLTDTNIGTFFSQGTPIAFEVLDMSRLTSGPLIVDAEYGFIKIYDEDGQAQYKDIDFYDKYILNDRLENDQLTELDWKDEYRDVTRFWGTEDSEYVVVGDGGGNELHAGNQLSGSIVRETDIVDYSRFTTTGSGVIIDLGNSAEKFVDVTESDGDTTRTIDKIAGFEGVVGSDGDDIISGSNTGNYLQGGDGDDFLIGYSLHNERDFGGFYSSAVGDLLYDDQYMLDELAYHGDEYRFDQAYFADSSDLLVGGAGWDTLHGGAGSDALVDLDGAVMWGSDVRGAGGGLRDNNNSDLAEYDAFIVRGDGTAGGTAKIENFHLSKNGTGLAGRSSDANDSIIFSANMADVIKIAYLDDPAMGEALFGQFITNGASVGTGTGGEDPILKAGSGAALYNYIYDNLTFTQTQVWGGDAPTNDMKLTATFSPKSGVGTGFDAVIGEVIIADMVTALGVQNAQGRFQNQAEVVELAWLADRIANTPEKFNPKMDLDMIKNVEGSEWLFVDMKIAVALELLQAGTIRAANEYGVMAASRDDLSLTERIYNPGVASDTILGSAAKDSYEFIVQDFGTAATNAPKDYVTGNDTIFDIGGSDDTLAFSEATISELKFSAVPVGRESGANSLMVKYDQTLTPDNNNPVVTNRGEITWQGHFRAGGRQAAEFVEVSDGSGGVDRYTMAKTEYEYDRKGYVIAGSDKIVAKDTFNAIMVGRNDGNDDFVFKTDSGFTLTQQKASIAGFTAGDKIDISDYEDKYGDATYVLTGQKAVVTFKETANPDVTKFTLELAFQDAVIPADLLFLYSTP